MRPRNANRWVRPAVGLVAVVVLAVSAVLAVKTLLVKASDTTLSGWVLDSDGSVVAFGDAREFGDSPGPGIAVSLVSNSSNTGYWVLWTGGRVGGWAGGRVGG